MIQKTKIYQKIFITCLYLLFFIYSLWFFWANLFALFTPDLNFPLVALEKSRQIQFLIYDPFIIILSIIGLISGGEGSNPKLENFAVWFCLSIIVLVDPLIEITKELSRGKDISAILNEREDITTGLLSALIIGSLIISLVVAKKVKSSKN